MEKALIGAFSVIVKTDFESNGSFTALVESGDSVRRRRVSGGRGGDEQIWL